MLSLGFLLSPGLAVAAESTVAQADPAVAQAEPASPAAPAAPPQRQAPSPAMRAAMQQARQQMEQIHLQARNQMLASLSPAHRTAVANIIGQMAISPNPDMAVAARQIDALLSQPEGQAILRTHSQAMTATQTLRTQMRTQFENSLTPDQRAQMEARRAQFAQAHPNGMPQRAARPGATDPGAILLRNLTGGAGRGMHGGPGGPGGPGGISDAPDWPGGMDAADGPPPGVDPR